MILRSAFLTAYHNLSILTILISLSDISNKSTVQQSENSYNLTVWESDNSDDPIRHFWKINCQYFQQSNSARIQESDHSNNSD